MGLTCKRINSEVNAGVLVLAAMLSDLILFVFVLTGIEFVIPPPNYAHVHYLGFYFPYSHGLAATLVWSAVTFAVFYFVPGHHKKKLTAALAVAAAVFSHFILDAIVHLPEIPVGGPHSQMIGMGLWTKMPLALGVEGAIAVGGTYRYLQVAKLRRKAAITVVVIISLLFVLTVVGMTLPKTPPKPIPQAITSILMMAILAAVFGRLDKKMEGQKES